MTDSGCMDAVAYLGHTLQAIPQRFHHSRQPFALPWLDHGGSSRGEQSHHGADLEPSGATVGKAQDVVVESILLVPHSVRSHLVHGDRDPQEMLRKLHSHVFVESVVGRQLHCYLQHVLREHGNPCGTVCLLEAATGGQWGAAVEDAYVVQSQEAALK